MSTERALTNEERGIIEFVIQHGMTSGQQEALEQLAVARYAGLSHGGEDVCFDISLTADARPVMDVESPIGVDICPNGGIRGGQVLLWLTDGRISGLELWTVTEPDGPNAPWPRLNQLVESASDS